MRITFLRMRNTDPRRPSFWMDYPMLLNEEPRCSLQEEFDSFEGLPFEEEWDQ